MGGIGDAMMRPRIRALRGKVGRILRLGGSYVRHHKENGERCDPLPDHLPDHPASFVQTFSKGRSILTKSYAPG
jgi:hypothetical protein